ncbi:CTP synthase [Patescibacteria group bacterium]
MAKKEPTKFIFVTGGVISGIGKGIASASLARLLKDKGYSVSCMKADMYINVDAGTMRPTVHGEVFVTEDGMETDQDIGNYERFLDEPLNAKHYTTTGQIYQSVIERERNLMYDGICVEVVPHIPEEIIRRVKEGAKDKKAEIFIVEIGGTAGEYQQAIFLEAIRMMNLQLGAENVVNVHVAYLPIPEHLGEMKSKPVQHSVRMLNSASIQPDFIVARSEEYIDEERRRKISIFCNVESGCVIAAPNVDSIYKVPLIFAEQRFGEKILRRFDLKPRKNDSRAWKSMVRKVVSAKKEVKIGVVGKYFDVGDFTLEDSYISVIEALKHASWVSGAKPVIDWIDSKEFERNRKNLKRLKEYDGIIVPGGFGSSGIEGKIRVIEFVRKNKIPYFGLCYGMQLAVIEFARNVVGLKKAHTTEVKKNNPDPVIDVMEEQVEKIENLDLGGSMRLGSYPCKIISGTVASESYKKPKISERHRHRYEFNNEYRKTLEEKGLKIAGVYPAKNLVEIIENPDHPWFVGVQFHPEFQSSPLNPHPLFVSFIKAAIKRK